VVISRGARNSRRRISPGWMMGRWFVVMGLLCADLFAVAVDFFDEEVAELFGYGDRWIS
jgi:hypothetical protein